MRILINTVVRLGAGPVLRRHHVQRPGGGHCFLRTHGRLEQAVSYAGSWRDHTGQLELRTSQSIGTHQLWTALPCKFYLDLQHGDAADTAVEVGHWLETVLLPQLQEDLDLLQLAHAYEKRQATLVEPRMQECAGLWELLG